MRKPDKLEKYLPASAHPPTGLRCWPVKPIMRSVGLSHRQINFISTGDSRPDDPIRIFSNLPNWPPVCTNHAAVPPLRTPVADFTGWASVLDAGGYFDF